jgi:hypothetical protein
MPKDVDLSPCSQKDLDEIAQLLNTRPRKRFDFKTPEDMMRRILTENSNSMGYKFIKTRFHWMQYLGIKSCC